jgi:4-hydroxy-tetrahydrodipicolinate reductase
VKELASMTDSTSTSVVLLGSAGRMGKAAVKALSEHPAISLSGCISPQHGGQDAGTLAGLSAPLGLTTASNLEEALAPFQVKPQVGLNLTHAAVVESTTLALVEQGLAPVIGASGLDETGQAKVHEALLKANLPGLLVPNFALGAVLLMRFAAQAAKYFDHAELLELHHNQKADAPSGTAVHTASAMAEALQGSAFGPSNAAETETLPGARGAVGPKGLRVHSVRLPGLVAHQEVLFGGPGQLLTLRHDSFNRESFMPGVCLAVSRVQSLIPGLHVGLDVVLDD